MKDTCVKVLVKAWLGVLDDDLLKLLDCLDCQNYSAECQKLLSTLMQSRDPATLVSEFDILDERFDSFFGDVIVISNLRRS